LLADSSEPRAMMVILRTSFLTVNVGPLKGCLPNSAPVYQSDPRAMAPAPSRQPMMISALRLLPDRWPLDGRDELNAASADWWLG
jgi:hypothetical protein